MFDAAFRIPAKHQNKKETNVKRSAEWPDRNESRELFRPAPPGATFMHMREPLWIKGILEDLSVFFLMEGTPRFPFHVFCGTVHSCVRCEARCPARICLLVTSRCRLSRAQMKACGVEGTLWRFPFFVDWVEGTQRFPFSFTSTVQRVDQWDKKMSHTRWFHESGACTGRGKCCICVAVRVEGT